MSETQAQTEAEMYEWIFANIKDFRPISARILAAESLVCDLATALQQIQLMGGRTNEGHWYCQVASAALSRVPKELLP